ncbi:hypothetical protein [Candidatus Uabimicrobium sp. HlEnr_7]|uniref:hypothetical protein n=1 Tax=Candidatus Uabimicrobium helgolandensis TaxID=3095367 RepID=UPI00355851C8
MYSIALSLSDNLMNVMSLSGSIVAAILSMFIFFRTSNKERPRVLIRQTSKVVPAQDVWKTGDVFRNYFETSFIIANQSSLPNALLGVKSFFHIDGKWVEDDIMTSEKTSLPQNIQPLCTIPFEISAVKWIKGEPGKDNAERAQAHPSLPDTVKIKLQFEMLSGKPVDIMMEYKRKKD